MGRITSGPCVTLSLGRGVDFNNFSAKREIQCYRTNYFYNIYVLMAYCYHFFFSFVSLSKSTSCFLVPPRTKVHTLKKSICVQILLYFATYTFVHVYLPSHLSITLTILFSHFHFTFFLSQHFSSFVSCIFLIIIIFLWLLDLSFIISHTLTFYSAFIFTRRNFLTNLCE